MPLSYIVVAGAEPARPRICEFLETNGFAVREAHSLATLRRALAQPTDVVIGDDSVTAGDHKALLGAVRSCDEQASIVLLVRTATLAQATAAIRHGADHLLRKPVDLAALLIVVQRLVETQIARRRLMAAQPATTRRSPDPFVGDSRAIRQLTEQAHRIVHSDAPVLVQGETGTGKGVLASWLHSNGPRADQAFVDINCAGLSRELIENELFGHERGAFTGAGSQKIGLFEVAHQGTVFLDEIGEIDLNLQPRLLKVLEDKRFRRLGDVRDRVVDVRLIAATNRDLASRSRDGAFRADLYYRINTITLTVPPLRERREDIPVLARNILHSLGRPEVELAPDALQALVAYEWPGNIRELRNALDRAVVISKASRLTRRHLHFDTPTADTSVVTLESFRPSTLDEAERRHIEQTLRYARGSVDRAAVLLGLSRSALYKRIKRFRTD